MKARLEAEKKNMPEARLKKMQERLAAMQKDSVDKAADAAAAQSSLALAENEVVRQAYLRTLSRLPTADEQDRCLNYLAEAESPLAGVKGLLWTLLNTKEFIVNH